MELEQLKQFKKVAERENISIAATELYISQPTLTRAMYTLEEDLGVKLFDRKKNRIKLNSCGREMLSYVDRILDDVEVLQLAAKRYVPDNYILNVYSSMPSSLRYFIKKYAEDNKDSNILIVTKTIDDSLSKKSLMNRSADVVLCGNEFRSKDIYQIPYYTFYMRLTVPKNHPLAEKEELSLSELSGKTFVFPGGPDSLAKRHILSEINKKTDHPNIIIEEDFVLFTDMLKHSDYLAFTSPFSTEYHKDYRKIIPLKDKELKITLYLSYLKENSEKVEPFIKWMVDNYSKILKAI